MAPLESLLWLLVGTQSLAWLSIFTYETWERNEQKDSLIRLFKTPYCRSWVEPGTLRRYYYVNGHNLSATIEALLASSTFAQLTQEEQDAS